MKNHTQIEAMKRIRAEYPYVPQRRLARMVSEMNPTETFYQWVPRSVKLDICRLTTRFSTNYNRIRRIDGSIR